MSEEIHFEVFCKTGEKGAWTLRDAFETRDPAINAAKSLLAKNSANSVRVTKERYDPETGEFRSISILEEGPHKYDKATDAKKEAELPCFQPGDLYTVHARAMIGRILSNLLERWGVTVSELMHRADLIEKLEASGTELQHAIQKYAIAYAGEKNQSVQGIIKQLNELISKATARIYKDDRAGKFPKISERTFTKTTEKLTSQGGDDFLLSAGLATFLSKAKSREDKLQYLLGLTLLLPKGEKAKTLGSSVIDQFLSEMLSGKAAIRELLGPQDDMGAALLTMANLFLGRLAEKRNPGFSKGIYELNKHFASDDLPRAKAALGRSILLELKSPRRLVPECLEEEVALVRKLANLMVLGQGPLLSAEDISEAFTARSKSLVAQNTIETYLSSANHAVEKIEMLLTLEENIVGAENKRSLAAFILPLVQSHQCAKHFLQGSEPVLRRLSNLATLQESILKTGFQDSNKIEISETLDQLALQMEASANLFDSIDAQDLSIPEKAIALLRLCHNKVLPQGECEKKAKQQVVKYMKTPGFMELLAAGGATQGEAAETATLQITEFKSLLDETGLRAML